MTIETKLSPVLHVFRVTKSFSTVNQYDLIELVGGNTQLTEQIRISRNRSSSKSGPEYYLSPNPKGNWVPLIGLRRTTPFDTIYIGYAGEAKRKNDTLIVNINENQNIAEVLYFKDFYSNDAESLLNYFNLKN